MAVLKFETKVLIIYQLGINMNNIYKKRNSIKLNVNNNKMKWDEDDMNDVYTIITSS